MTDPSTARPQDSLTRKCSRTGPGAPRKPRSRFDGTGSRTRVTAERRPGAVGEPPPPRRPADFLASRLPFDTFGRPFPEFARTVRRLSGPVHTLSFNPKPTAL